MEPQSKNWDLRYGQVDDHPFIYSSWLKSFRDSSVIRRVPNSVYFAQHHKLIEKTLTAPTTKIVVSVATDDPGQIYGYVVGSYDDTGPILHWVYCKHVFRGCGISRELEAAIVDGAAADTVRYTHRVNECDEILKRRGYIYNPYIFWSHI